MSIVLEPIDHRGADRDVLIEFFSTNAFPFHGHAAARSAEEAAEFVDSAGFVGEDGAALWAVDSELGRVGLVRFGDLGDPTPMIDLRLAERFRGRGLGVPTLLAATDHVFTTTSATRFEGQTREDNTAMRTVFDRAGWSKEAHHRRAWPTPDGTLLDAIGYAILREEWETGVTVPVRWDD
ncbi:GNAT family N-acetyltransferase [Brevibacterium metallidurans]|uniref:N-acetyltransferase domain-containing protein n=1 Tax=Brevibacterium metallidurans TaxID=1482676 RepID=A0ABN0SS16_9MICO